jgi:hypothetical protein
VGLESSKSTQNRVYSSYRPMGRVFFEHWLDTPHDAGLLSIQILFAKALSRLLWADAASLGSRDTVISHRRCFHHKLRLCLCVPDEREFLPCFSLASPPKAKECETTFFRYQIWLHYYRWRLGELLWLSPSHGIPRYPTAVERVGA